MSGLQTAPLFFYFFILVDKINKKITTEHGLPDKDVGMPEPIDGDICIISSLVIFVNILYHRGDSYMNKFFNKSTKIQSSQLFVLLIGPIT